MAKHEVKCPYCNIVFDTNKEEFIQLGRRYAHKSCYDKAGGQPPHKQKRTTTKKAQDPDLEALKDYISSLFGDKTNWAMVMKQIKTYKEDNGYSYSGILKSLIYFFEVQHGSKEKSNGTIGIVPYCYQAAYNYYLGIFLANQQNENKSFICPIKEYSISPPRMRGSKQKLFKLGEENEE